MQEDCKKKLSSKQLQMIQGQIMRGADAVIKLIADQGITTIFGYPGGAIMPIYDAIYDSSIEHLLCRHEQGAGFAAIGYARASGKTGVCLATSGPGATNLITALADALLDSVPIVAITGQVPTHLIGTDSFQEIDILGMSLSCTKHSFIVTEIDELIPTIIQAFEIARSGRPGPVLIDIPKNIQTAELEFKLPLQAVKKTESYSHDSVKQAVELIEESDQPILYIGGGVGIANAVEELRTFISTTRIPSVVTLKGLGCITKDTEGYLGMLGMHGLKAANLAVQECDLLIAIGARFDDRVTGHLASFAPKAKVIHLDIDKAEIGKLRAVTLSICEEFQHVLPALTQRITKDFKIWCEKIETLKKIHYADYQHPSDFIYAPAMLNSLAHQLPKDSVITCDVGQHQMWVAQHMFFERPENHLSSGGLGTMGFGLPAAIGAQIVRPDSTVVVVSGDGSFMMNVQELTTIKRQKLPIKILLIDNQRLGMVKQWQELFFDKRYSETDLSDNPDFVRMAAAFDIKGRTITHAAEVQAGIKAMLNSEGAFLLHVTIDEKLNVWPLVPPGASNKDMIEENRDT